MIKFVKLSKKVKISIIILFNLLLGVSNIAYQFLRVMLITVIFPLN